MASPLSQLYCKRLSASNVEEFLWAQPDHVGWQINLSKLLPDELARAVDASRVVATRLKGTGVKSVLLLHPSNDPIAMKSVLDQVEPDIFLTSAQRSKNALAALRLSIKKCQFMVPIGIPVSQPGVPEYNPISEMLFYNDTCDWYTTDTITPSDSIDRFGCSGQTSDWSSLASVVRLSPHPVVVAGGLNPTNVADLWRLCQPKGFDAHTSVCSDGQPDRTKAKAFVEAVRGLT